MNIKVTMEYQSEYIRTRLHGGSWGNGLGSVVWGGKERENITGQREIWKVDIIEGFVARGSSYSVTMGKAHCINEPGELWS